MIKIENVEVVGWEHTIRGMRNPKNSWERSDSGYKCPYYRDQQRVCDGCKDNMCIGENDHKLMMQLTNGGAVHAKYRRMIVVYLDITAPLYWWKEFDTYKVGTVANSCSTMHKIHDKEFSINDFSYEHLEFQTRPQFRNATPDNLEGTYNCSAYDFLCITRDVLNNYRKLYLETKDKKYWWQMIQLLPSSYNQKRTIMLNYEVLVGMYESRKDHKLDEWREFCKWIESLPYSEIITGEEK